MGVTGRDESPKRESCGLFDTGHFIGMLQPFFFFPPLLLVSLSILFAALKDQER